ncbi:hypothetical protein [Chitinimonas sp. BJYL2]|uniref:hypothetical protein n=1 Tax=Chitinimonas sp. BJYL2 TaxID=2976696 RepID=UPI0022B499B2|nr:hypothetical protein [Chitinimonas sp. BJYL2]
MPNVLKPLSLAMLLCLPLGVQAEDNTSPLVLAGDPGTKPKTTVEKRIVITRVGEDGNPLPGHPPVPPLPPLPPLPPMPEMIRLHAGHDGMPMEDPDTAVFVDREFGPGGQQVSGQPFSAEAVSEKVQTLGDGNRIVRKVSTRLYRDAQGRKRFEMLGEDGQARTVFIFDPASKTHYTLNPASKTATKLVFPAAPGVPMVSHDVETKAGGKEVRVHRNVVVIRDAKGQETRIESGGEAPADREVKSLGSKEIDGIKAEGSQTVRVIAAGKVGNEKPIQIVSERWYAPDLKVVLATSTRDPRYGETSYRLSKIKRSEPDANLFKPPAGFKVHDLMTRLPKPPAPPAPPKAPAASNP